MAPFDRSARDPCGRVGQDALAALDSAAHRLIPAMFIRLPPSVPQNLMVPPDPDPRS